MDFVFGDSFKDHLEQAFSQSNDFLSKNKTPTNIREFFIHENIMFMSETWIKRWLRNNPFAQNKGIPDNLEDMCKRLERQLADKFSVKKSMLDEHKSLFFNQYKPQLEIPEYNFIGRKQELSELYSFFQQEPEEINKGLCISKSVRAIGGMGKTSLAKHYALCHAHEYSDILYLDGRSNNLLQQITRHLRSQKNCDAYPESYEEAFEWIFKLAPCKKILLLIDDVQARTQENGRNPILDQIRKIHSVVNDNKNIKARTHILLTSRTAFLPEIIHSKNLEELSTEDAIDLFQERRGHDKDNKSLIEEIVIEKLHGHPLSICLVASYAREKRLGDLAEIIDFFDKKPNALMPPTLHKNLPGYPKNLFDALDLSFQALSDSSKYFLLLLSLFRRSPISRTVVKRCFEASTHNWEEPLKELVKSVIKGRGGIPAKNELGRYCLIETVNTQITAKDEAFQLHEVIFDYCHTLWGMLYKDGNNKLILDNLEQSFSSGSCKYISESLNKDNLDYWDVFSLSGVLFPGVSKKDELYPSNERVISTLEFWYTHFQFQNYIYDTGIQTLLLERQLALLNHINDTGIAISDPQRMVLYKLIAHTFYTTPKGKDSNKNEPDNIELYFGKALELLNTIEENTELDARSRWYRIFILDHRSNAASKSMSLEQRKQKTQFLSDLKTIEYSLPTSLKNIDVIPSQADKDLILRAAHFWGHRGNQDAHFALQAYSPKTKEFTSFIESSITCYTLAINYRIAALKAFRPAIYEQRLRAHIKDAAYIADWMKALEPFEHGDAERFTSTSQAIGDTAHQYRGINFVLFLKLLSFKDKLANEELELLGQSYRLADSLWNVAKNTATRGEPPLKYKLWMASTRVWMRWLNQEINLDTLSIEDVRQQLDDQTNLLVKEIGISDGFIIESQQKLFDKLFG